MSGAAKLSIFSHCVAQVYPENEKLLITHNSMSKPCVLVDVFCQRLVINNAISISKGTANKKF